MNSEILYLCGVLIKNVKHELETQPLFLLRAKEIGNLYTIPFEYSI